MSYRADKNIYNLINATSSDMSRIPEKIIDPIFQTVVGYTQSLKTKNMSLSKTYNPSKKIIINTDANLCLLPANSIIDMVEFNGLDKFDTKGSFNIGLGQLNDTIILPLVENTTATIANNRGCRQFTHSSLDGTAERNITLYETPINISLEHPINSGYLQVIIYYHSIPKH
jgi:hypothetical protein